jgi:ATP adenylyltransferase
MSLYHLPAARTDSQRNYMRELEQDQICVFCPEHFIAYHSAPIEMEFEYWYVTRNDFPYRGAALHLLIVSRQHVTELSELPDEAGSELLKVIREIKKVHICSSEAIVIRSGDMRFNGGSVAHLHIHFVVGDVDNPDHEPIRFKVSSRSD